ncbi:hypothetical protein J437_LFUL003962 [Ladona fulva]|uniref:AEBP2-like C-terminal SH3 domain-containing protein n=1 Tax=Ladona fulva TaxID=123851 RepID=A0A8K0JUG1_LADFU|nr:hypothetical protein J437_LFUL003962 [Ladona fulva]
MFDYFDAGVMEELQHRLVAVAEKELSGEVTPRGDEVLLTSKVLARRTEVDGKTKVLLRWYPEDIMPDEWVAENEVRAKCTHPVRTLPPSAHSSLRATLFGTSAPKHRRKTKPPPNRTPLFIPSSPFLNMVSPSSSSEFSSPSSSIS